MRFFLIIMIIVILLGLLFISLDNIAESGFSGLVLAAISCAALFRVFRYVFDGIGASRTSSASGGAGEKSPNPFDYLVLGEIAKEAESEELGE
ncbi:MAG: hypothetical protein FWB75_00825 [Oscillospiraceae bacterium]|nr:hypothetical protein [Oscillospiraceae bacterium]